MAAKQARRAKNKGLVTRSARTTSKKAVPVAAAAASAPDDDAIGAHLRRARRDAGMTLAAVAAASGLSVGYLSEVERSRLTPSISALKRIADVLKIPAYKVMFEYGGATFASDAVTVVRRDARKRISFPHSSIDYQLLTPDLKRRAAWLWMIVPPGTESGPTFSHTGEDGVVVLRGRLGVEVGGVWHVLKAGDSIYFNSAIAHRWRNDGRDTVEAIWLSTPPSF